jgi:hypothetical protein
MTTDPFGKLVDHLESEVDWRKIFGVVDSVYSDDGFTTNADNFTRATTIEKAVEKFSDLERVDQPGWFCHHIFFIHLCYPSTTKCLKHFILFPLLFSELKVL